MSEVGWGSLQAVEDFQSLADDASDLDIEQSREEFGLFLIDGSDSALIEALQDGQVIALFSGTHYDALIEQEELAEQQPGPPPTEGGEEPDDPGDEDGESDE